MTNSAKRRALILLLLTALVTMLLAAALSQLELQKGIPLPGTSNGVGGSPVEEGGSVSVNISTFAKIAFAIMFLLVILYIIARLRLKPNWKEIAQAFVVIAVISLALTGILFAFADARVTSDPLQPEMLPTEVRLPGPDLAPVPPGLLWLVWAGLGVITILLVIAFLRMRGSARRADPLVIEAEQAVQALKAGQDLRSVIIHCYRQMSRILQEEQDLTREEAMTAREFETLLETRGIPRPPVSQLTRLFEMARYGAALPGQEVEQQALDSLNAIIQFSHKKKDGALK
jgi:hypothetical protein